MSRRRRPRDGGRWAAWTGARRPSRGLVVASDCAAFSDTHGAALSFPLNRLWSVAQRAFPGSWVEALLVLGRRPRVHLAPAVVLAAVIRPGALRRRAFVGCTRTHTHTPHPEPPPMATYTETDDASHRARVAARGLGACVRARAHKPEQTLSLQGSRYVDLSAFPAVFRRPGRWAKRCGRRPIDLNPPNLKRSTPGRVYR